MNRPNAHGISLERLALRIAAVSGAVAIAMACIEPSAVSIAYRLAVFSCLAPALGSLILVLLHRITGGQWGSHIAPFLRAGCALLPWIWLCALPALFLPPPAGTGSPRLAHGGLGYDGFTMVTARACLFAALFFGFKRAVSGGLGRERDPIKNEQAWVGPVGLIVLFFMLTLVADDWLESLEPGWHSTGFTVVWIAGQAVSGLSLALLGALRTGARPKASGAAGRTLGLDWGDLLLATFLFWSYVSFAQFLIIWAGNLPEETSWYARRESGVWACVIPVLAVFGFAVPFALLLSRRIKASAAGLAWAAGLLLAAQWAYLAWTILPAGGALTFGGAVLTASLLAAAAGIFLNRYACVARRLEGVA
jgi:hypothetical protein